MTQIIVPKNITAITAFICLAIWASCTNKEISTVEKTARPVKYAKITTSGSADRQTFSGISQSSKEAAVSFKVSGTINRLNIKVGDQVRQGQLLASLDAIDYAVQQDQAFAQMKSAETQVKSAQAQLVNSKSTYDRAERLYENRSIPLSEYQQAKAAFEAAESQYNASLAQVDASQAQLTSASNQVSYARLLAPFSGIINSVLVEENELVAVGNPVAVISAQDNPEILVGLPEVFIARVERNDTVQVIFSSPISRTYQGRITEVSFGSGSSATYPITVQIDNPDSDLRPGMAASVVFDFSESDASQPAPLVAPIAAVSEGTEGRFVFKLLPDGDTYQAAKQPVELGKLVSDGFTINSGLAEGDLVATAGLKSLLDGMRVTLLDDNAVE